MSLPSVAFVGARGGGKSSALAIAMELYPGSYTSNEQQFPATARIESDNFRRQFEEFYIHEPGQVAALQSRGWKVVHIHNNTLALPRSDMGADAVIATVSLEELRERLSEFLQR